MSRTKDLWMDQQELAQPEQEPEMLSCPRDVLRDFAGMVAPRIGVKVLKRKPVDLSANGTAGGISHAEIFEWVNPAGEVVGRKVSALGEVETWLRADLCTEVLIARADEAAERERVIAEVKQFAEASRRRGEQRAETYVLSSALIHAAARRNATLGRLYDMNSRGDRVRGNLVAALDRALKAEEAK